MEILMNVVLKGISAVILGLSAATTFAMPASLITHNNTDVESNAYIAGFIPSPYPTAAHDTRSVAWNMVRLACFGHTTNDICQALIKVATNTDKPVELGYLSMNIKSGDITPTVLSSQGYTITVNRPGETTITKN
jgi:hypothetical protein